MPPSPPPPEPGLPPADAVVERHDGPERSPAAPERRRILVVDDSADVAESLALLLRMEGHEVELAHTGLAALEQAVTFRPEVVLLDIGLPELDGYQVARRLRQQQQTAGALLIAVTGYGQDEDKGRARQAGFDHHLTKPVDPRLIYELLARPRLGGG